MTSKKITIGIIGAVIFIVAGIVVGRAILYTTGSRQEKNTLRPLSGEQTIRITEDGFVPDTMMIHQGTKIRFVNVDTLAHWPASDLHPSHTLYAEFDPHMPIDPSKEWDFTFEKIGTWSMHDHLAPYIIGTIIVVQ